MGKLSHGTNTGWSTKTNWKSEPGDDFKEAEVPPKSKPANDNEQQLWQAKADGTGRLQFIGEDRAYIPKPELVRDTMPRTGVGFFGGQSGALKSFFGIHAATCLMTGEPLAGREIERTGGVVYFAAEGEGTIEGRLKARRMQLEYPGEILPMHLLTSFGAVADTAAYAALEARLKEAAEHIRGRFDVPLVAVIVDTVAAAGMIPEDKENDQGAWQKVFDALKPISTRLDCLIILVHHAGKVASAGLRGSSNARAGADFALMLACDRDEITGDTANHFLHLAKTRDAPEGPIAAIQKRVVEIGARDDGSPITTLVLDFDTQGRASAKKREPSVAEKTFLIAFDEASASHSESVHVHGDLSAPVILAVGLERIRTEFDLRYVASQGDPKKRADLIRKQFRAALSKVTESHAFGSGFWNETEWLWKIPAT